MKFDVAKALSAVESIAVIGGIVFAVWQVLEISKQTTIQAETLKQSQQIASADLVLKLRATLDDSKFAKLVGDIQNHDHNYPLLSRSDGGKGGKFPDLEIEQYLSVFEDIGYLVEGDLIIGRMGSGVKPWWRRRQSRCVVPCVTCRRGRLRKHAQFSRSGD
jgi:hypothetical protein